MKILFVCKYNRFRSKVAEAFFRSYDIGKKHDVKSAGIRTSLMSPFVSERPKKLMEQRGVTIQDDNSNRINDYLVNWADRIIIVANDVSSDIFPKNKTEIWEVDDAEETDERKIKIKINEIDEKVKALVENLNKNI